MLQGIAKILVIVLIFSKINIFQWIGQPQPFWWQWCMDNRLYSCVMLFFACNAAEGYLISSGAFEIHFNGEIELLIFILWQYCIMYIIIWMFNLQMFPYGPNLKLEEYLNLLNCFRSLILTCKWYSQRWKLERLVWISRLMITFLLFLNWAKFDFFLKVMMESLKWFCIFKNQAAR